MSRWIGPCAAALALAGCAAEAVTHDAISSDALAPGAAPAVAPYRLTEPEMKLDCGKLTGQMKVKIAIMRGDAGRTPASATSRTMQQAVTPVLGGTKRGADPIGDANADRAKLDAFNTRLAEKKCKTLDIDAELRGESPQPAAKAAKKAS